METYELIGVAALIFVCGVLLTLAILSETLRVKFRRDDYRNWNHTKTTRTRMYYASVNDENLTEKEAEELFDGFDEQIDKMFDEADATFDRANTIFKRARAIHRRKREARRSPS